MENISCDDDDDHDYHHHQIGILLPRDVLIQILVLLPVISLLRFKSVCKSWRALIQTSLFIDLHLNTTITNNFGTFIFQTSESYVASNKFGAFMLFGGSGSGSGSGSGGDGEKEDGHEFEEEEEEEELKLEDLGFPPGYKVSSGILVDHIFMVGSCNGLICLHDTSRREVSLWNPATRQFRLLPKSLTLPAAAAAAAAGKVEQDFVAFGYDVKTNDYKVLQISCFKPSMRGNRWFSVKEYIFQVQVYSLTTDSWRLLEDINSLPAFPQQHGINLNHGVYLNGRYYFLGRYYIEYVLESGTQLTTGCMILSFDFTKEIFTTIQLPNDHHIETILTCFGEKLAIFVCMVVKEDDESDSKFYDIWVLNEHGVKESWTKLHSTVPYSFGFGSPRCISNSGEFALLATVVSVGGSLVNGVYVLNCELCEQLQLLNLVTKEIKKEFPTGNPVIRADVYKQSLVSIGGNDTTA